MTGPRAGRARAAHLAVAAAAAAALTAVVAQVLTHGPLTTVDTAVRGWQTARPPGQLRPVLLVVAALGQRWLYTPVLLTVAVAAAARRRRALPLLMTCGALLSLWGVVAALKTWTGRLPPTAGRDVVHAAGSSLPSGHTAGAVLACGLLLLLRTDPTARAAATVARRWWLAPALTGAAVSAAVVLLDWHWTTDALAGWLAGTAVLHVTVAALPTLRPARPSRQPTGHPASRSDGAPRRAGQAAHRRSRTAASADHGPAGSRLTCAAEHTSADPRPPSPAPLHGDLARWPRRTWRETGALQRRAAWHRVDDGGASAHRSPAEGQRVMWPADARARSGPARNCRF